MASHQTDTFASMLRHARSLELPSRDAVDEYVGKHKLAERLDVAANDTVKHQVDDPWYHIAIHCLDWSQRDRPRHLPARGIKQVLGMSEEELKTLLDKSTAKKQSDTVKHNNMRRQVSEKAQEAAEAVKAKEEAEEQLGKLREEVKKLRQSHGGGASASATSPMTEVEQELLECKEKLHQAENALAAQAGQAGTDVPVKDQGAEAKYDALRREKEKLADALKTARTERDRLQSELTAAGERVSALTEEAGRERERASELQARLEANAQQQQLEASKAAAEAEQALRDVEQHRRGKGGKPRVSFSDRLDDGGGGARASAHGGAHGGAEPSSLMAVPEGSPRVSLSRLSRGRGSSFSESIADSGRAASRSISTAGPEGRSGWGYEQTGQVRQRLAQTFDFLQELEDGEEVVTFRTLEAFGTALWEATQVTMEEEKPPKSEAMVAFVRVLFRRIEAARARGAKGFSRRQWLEHAPPLHSAAWPYQEEMALETVGEILDKFGPNMQQMVKEQMAKEGAGGVPPEGGMDLIFSFLVDGPTGLVSRRHIDAFEQTLRSFAEDFASDPTRQRIMSDYLATLRRLCDHERARRGYTRVEWSHNRDGFESRDAHAMIAQALQSDEAAAGWRHKLALEMFGHVMERLFEEVLRPSTGWPVPSRTLVACASALVKEEGDDAHLRPLVLLLAGMAEAHAEYTSEAWQHDLVGRLAIDAPPGTHVFAGAKQQDGATTRLHAVLDLEMQVHGLSRALREEEEAGAVDPQALRERLAAK